MTHQYAPEMQYFMNIGRTHLCNIIFPWGENGCLRGISPDPTLSNNLALLVANSFCFSFTLSPSKAMYPNTIPNQFPIQLSGLQQAPKYRLKKKKAEKWKNWARTYSFGPRKMNFTSKSAEFNFEFNRLVYSRLRNIDQRKKG